MADLMGRWLVDLMVVKKDVPLEMHLAGLMEMRLAASRVVHWAGSMAHWKVVSMVWNLVAQRADCLA